MKAALAKAGVAVGIAAASVAAIAFGLSKSASESELAQQATRAVDRGPASVPRCQFAPGQQAAFALESTVRDVRGEDKDHLRGTLSWEVVEQLGEGRWRLRAALSGVSHSQTLTLPQERVTGSLTDPFFVAVDASCRLVDFGFSPEWDVRRRQLVQSTLATHEFVMPPTARSKSWSATQRDGLGSFEAGYALAAGDTARELRVSRRKAAYEQTGAAFGIEVVVVASEAMASFDRERPQWLMDVSGHERVQVRLQGELEADLVQRFRLLRDDSRFVPVPPLSPSDADFRDPADLEVERDRQIVAAHAERSYDEALDAFLARFAGGGKDHSYAAARELAGWLKSHPEGAQQLAAALRAGEIDGPARPALFLGLELSGTPEARGALSDLFVDGQLAAADRARAALALADIGEPTVDTAELLLARAQADEDALVSNVSLLGLGTMAKRSDEGELRSFVRDSLDDALAAASDEGEARVLLDAMGNSGDSAFADVLESHLGVESPTTREHAARALGRLDPAEAGPRLLKQLEAEADPEVSAAIVAAYRGPATTDAIATMADKLEDSSSATERAALINWLGTASSREPAAQRRLVAHAKRETDARLLQQIGAYVPAAELW